MITRSTILTLIILLSASLHGFSQTPLGINYQGIARSADGNPLINQLIGLRISITSGPDGAIDYIEEHHLETNDFGLFAAVVGQGQSAGSLNDVTWIEGNKWLKIDIDPQDQGNYMMVGTQQMLSVPYALYAAQSGDQLSPGVGIGISNGQISNTLPDQIISLNGTGATTVSGTYPNFAIESTDNIDDADADPANEIQTLTLNGDLLELTNGGSVDLSGYVNTDGQDLASVLAQGADANGAVISGLAEPVAAQDAATRNYVDTQDAALAGTITSNSTDISTEITNRAAGDTALQSELDLTQLDAGLNADGSFSADPTTTYLTTATSLKQSDKLLDTQLLSNTGAIDANSTAISTETTARTSADAAIKTKLDATQTGAGLEADGTYLVDGTTTYLGAATDLKSADKILDSRIAINAGDIATNSSTIASVATNLANTYAFNTNYVFTNSTGAVFTDEIVDISSTVIFDSFGQIVGNQIRIKENGTYLIYVQGESNFTNFMQVSIRVNGSDVHQVLKQNKALSTKFNDIGQFLLILNDGDYIELIVESSDSLGDAISGTVFGYKL